MIKSIAYECHGHRLDVMNDPDIQMISIQGVSPESTINTSSISGYDGATVISSQTPMRNISMVVRFICGDAEDAKRRLYNAFPVKAKGVLYYTTGKASLKIEGYVEKVEIIPTSFPLSAQISILCPNPFFTDLIPNSKTMAALRPLFRFPFTFNGPFKFSEKMDSVIDNFYNSSTVAISPIFEFYAQTGVLNPSIMNVHTYEMAKLNFNMHAGERIIIDTRKGYKRILLISNDETYDIFNAMDAEFKFINLSPGDNYLKYDADENGNGLQVTVTWENQHGGI